MKRFRRCPLTSILSRLRERVAGGRVRVACGYMLGAVALCTGLFPAASRAADALDERVKALTQDLRCPVCQNLSVADSPSSMAGQMRAFVREELSKGKSEDEVKAYLEQKYGEWILLNPPKRGLNWGLWIGGPAILGVGLLAVLVWLKRHRKPVELVSREVPPETAERVRKALKELEP